MIRIPSFVLTLMSDPYMMKFEFAGLVLGIPAPVLTRSRVPQTFLWSVNFASDLDPKLIIMYPDPKIESQEFRIRILETIHLRIRVLILPLYYSLMNNTSKLVNLSFFGQRWVILYMSLLKIPTLIKIFIG